MMSKTLRAMVLGLMLGAAPLPASATPAEEAQLLAQVDHAPVVTRHEGVFAGRKLRYRATVEGIEVPDAQGRPAARLVSFAYTAEGKGDPAKRPVLFLFNGGPITPSLWVHLGGFGPKRMAFPDDVKADPSTFRLTDNPDSPLAVADLVFVDPASTGYSRVLPGTAPNAYFSVKADGQQVAAFIDRWLTQHGRRTSPVYILGESYGTNRAAEVGEQLLSLPQPIVPAGIILFGQAVNIIEYVQRPANIMSYVVSLPSLAAIAWYHGRVDKGGRSFEQFLDEVRAFAKTDYLEALFLGNAIDPARKQAIAARLEALSGISADWYGAHDLRISKEQFRAELLKDKGLLLGRNDARYTAPLGPEGRAADPSSVIPTQTEAFFRAYMRDELKVAWPEPYLTGSPVQELDAWDWGGKTPFSDWPYYKSVSKVFDASPAFRLMVANGYYDTQTTIGAASYLVTQSGWPSDRVSLHYYEGGHMAYSVAATASRFGRDLRDFMTPAR